jgi:hypothetical protein
MLTTHIALVSEGDAVCARELTRVATALDKRVTRDFGPLWGIRATVDPVLGFEDIAVASWPIIIRDRKSVGGADGFHKDRHGPPFALVALTDSWLLTASHECLEMLADPFGDRIVPGPSLKRGGERVSYLVEVCDPPESEEFAYTVNDVLVSDFITRSYYEHAPATPPLVGSSAFQPAPACGLRFRLSGSGPPGRVLRIAVHGAWFNALGGAVRRLPDKPKC